MAPISNPVLRPRYGPRPASSKPKPRKRRAAPKVRTGCVTCKVRRVKCGEEKPYCLRCIKFGTPCSYAPIEDTKGASGRAVFSVRDPAPTSQPGSLLQIETEDGYRYFDVFRSKTSFEFLIHTSDAESIRIMLLQAGVFRQSIRHALAALGALEKVCERAPALPYNEDWGNCNRHHQNALRLYNRAITFMKIDASRGEQDLRTTLMTCVVIICFEAWTGNQALAIKQIQTAVNLIQEYKSGENEPQTGSNSSIAGVEDDLLKLFAHLAAMIISFTANSVASRSTACHALLRADVQETLTAMPDKFTSLKVAKFYKSTLMRYTAYLLSNRLQESKSPSWGRAYPISDNPHIEPGSTATCERHIAHIRKWLKAFEGLSKILYAEGGTNMFEGAILKMHINTIYLYLIGALAGDEMAYDNYFGELQEIVDLAEMVLRLRNERPKSARFTFENGLIISLQFAAQKCRYSVTRRKAIELLLTYPRREGLWDSTFSGKMMEWAVDVEEEFMENGQIPGWARITGVAKTEDLQRRTATLRCRQRKSESSDEFVAREKIIHW